jgi:hypothetical protein
MQPGILVGMLLGIPNNHLIVEPEIQDSYLFIGAVQHGVFQYSEALTEPPMCEWRTEPKEKVPAHHGGHVSTVINRQFRDEGQERGIVRREPVHFPRQDP